MINSIQEMYDTSLKYGDEIWVKEILPKIIEINNKYDSFFSKEQIEKCNQFNDDIKCKQKELKKIKTNFVYWLFLIFGLFFSILLVAPSYFAFKYLSNVKKKISSLEETISSLIQQKLEFLFNSVCGLELNNYFKEIISLTRYEDRGPLNKTISNLIKENSSFKLENNSKRNTFCSSWGVFGGDKIVVNLSTAKLKFEKPITSDNSSVTKYYVYSSTNINGKEEIYEDEWVETTTYQRPIFEYSNSNWFYMKSCENLELRLDKVSSSKDKSLWFDKYSDLENQKFNDLFNWKYNDKIQYRMIFTPYTQEFYVNNSFDKDDNFRENYNLKKKSSFITNGVGDYKLSLTKLLNEIIRIWKTNLIDIDNLIRFVAINHILTSYKNLTPGWILPILNSESHRDILLQIESQSIEPDLSTFHYVLNKLICKKVVSYDTDTFHEITKSFKFEMYDGTLIYGVKVKGISYEVINSRNSSNGMTSYVPNIDSKYLFMTYIKNKWKKLWFSQLSNILYSNEFDDEITPIIKKYLDQDIYISIDKSILSIYSNKIPKEKVFEVFEELISVIKKYN